MPHTALFNIDIQHSLAISPSTRVPHAQRVIQAGTDILHKARATIDAARLDGREPDLEIVIVQHEERAEEGDLVRGSLPWELVFPVREGDETERLVHKTVRDTFQSNPHLATELKSRGVKTIIAFGIQSECCVLSTCKGALKEGFEVVLLQGAHSTYDLEGKRAEEVEQGVEGELKELGARVMGWEDWEV